MHELSIVESIIEIIISEMPRHNLTKIESISLRIGEMRQVVPDALHFGFECLSKDTPLEGAKLNIENIPIKGCCNQCNHEFILENWLESCPNCHSNEIEIISGKELEIAEFEGS